MGVRFEQGDNYFNRFMGLIMEGFRLFGSMDIINFIPILRVLPWMKKNLIRITENRLEMAGFFQETVDQHRQTFQENKIRHIVDTYLDEIKKTTEKGLEDQLFQGKNHGKKKINIFFH